MYVMNVRALLESGMMMKYEIRLERMLHNAQCLGRLPSGEICLLKNALPGELVWLEPKRKKGVLQGIVQEEDILEAHLDRIPSSLHPGLDYSFLPYDKQLLLKQDVLKDVLARAELAECEVHPVIPSPKAWGYRNSIQVACSKEGIGYRRPLSHQVLPMHNDPVAQDSINAIWPFVSERAAGLKGVEEIVIRSNYLGEILLCLVARASAVNYTAIAQDWLNACPPIHGIFYAPHDERGRFRSGSERLRGKKHIYERYGDVDINVNISSFAQPNPLAAGRMFQDIRRLVESDDTLRGRAIDLFAGSGVIAMHISQCFDEVLVMDIDRSSMVRGERDAARLGLSNLRFQQTDARKLRGLEGASLLCIDPPRAGLSKAIRELILASDCSTLLYIACDVASWARDIAELSRHGFALQKAQAYDFYPQTHHIEMLSVLKR